VLAFNRRTTRSTWDERKGPRDPGSLVRSAAAAAADAGAGGGEEWEGDGFSLGELLDPEWMRPVVTHGEVMAGGVRKFPAAGGGGEESGEQGVGWA
jgi:hypothetical protein